MDLALGHVSNEGTDHQGRLTLTNEGGGSGDDRLTTRCAHDHNEEGCKLLDGPLQDAKIAEDLSGRTEEYDCGKDRNGEGII